MQLAVGLVLHGGGIDHIEVDGVFAAGSGRALGEAVGVDVPVADGGQQGGRESVKDGCQQFAQHKWALQIGGLGGVEAALGAHDQLAEFAGGAFAAAGLGHAMGVLAHKSVGAGHRHAQADPADHRQVRQVVAQIGYLCI
ncbi:hypothetical protein D3C80_1583560 [compost metagenome]